MRRYTFTTLITATMLALVGCGGTKDYPAQPIPAKNVILFIGDGMHTQHEVAASRYLTGTDNGLVWQSFPKQGQMGTWDVTTYDRYAFQRGQGAFKDTTFLTSVGYDETKGGVQPSTVTPVPDETYYLNALPKFGTNPASGHAQPATDSASAGTAIACGFKTDDGNIAWLTGDPKTGGNRTQNDGSLRTICEIARQDYGKAIGVVSTVPFTHATPATFVSHNVARGNYYTGINGYTGLGIADEIITDTKPDVVIGGGHPMLDNPTYDTKKGYISKAMHDALKTGKDFVFAERQAGVDGTQSLNAAAEKAAAEGKRLFGLYGGPGGNFEPPIPDKNVAAPSCTRGTTENPLLKDATLAALKVLRKNPNGLFLMVEQGDIDWANHANDYQWMMGTLWDLNEAVKATLAFLDQPGDDLSRENTLILVTSDHGNSYMLLDNAKKLGKGQMPEQKPRVPGMLRSQMVWRDDTETMTLVAKAGETEASYAAALGYTSPWNYPGGEVSYGSPNHTNELVTLAATGNALCLSLIKGFEGTWYSFGTKNTVDNTQLFHIMHRAYGAPSPVVLKPTGK